MSSQNTPKLALGICPDCDNRECFGNEGGKCRVLVDNNFGGKPCPFFKTKEQLAIEERKRQLREELMSL